MCDSSGFLHHAIAIILYGNASEVEKQLIYLKITWAWQDHYEILKVV